MADITWEQAQRAVADPATAATMLQTVAAAYPQLWLPVANHRNAYPELLDWLDSVGDGSVKAAVAARRAMTVPKSALAAGVPPVTAPPVTAPPVTAPPVTAPPVTAPTAVIPPFVPASTPPQTQAYPPSGLGYGQTTRAPVFPQAAPETPTSNRWLVPLIVILAVAVVAAAVLIYLFVIRSHDNPAPPAPVATSASPASASPTAPSPAPATVTVTSTVSVSPTPTPTPSVDPQMLAQQQLGAQIQRDSGTVAATLQDQWTTLLSTKQNGLVADGQTWTYQSIWQEYLALKSTYPSALLVQGDAYASIKLDASWYITASGITFATPDDALSWCDAQGLDDDHCFAFRFTDQSGTNAKHNK